MLSAAKVKVHGMQDRRWVTSDKLTQYRGVIKLFERDSRVLTNDVNIKAKRLKRSINETKKYISRDIRLLDECTIGDRQMVKNMLAPNKELKLALGELPIQNIEEAISHKNFLLRKQLDLVKYRIKKRSEKMIDSKLFLSILEDSEDISSTTKSHIQEQFLSGKIQEMIMKRDGAIAVGITYKKILDIMKKDAIYIDAVFTSIETDCVNQSACIQILVEIGQLATEYLDDRKLELQKLEKTTKENRKRNLKSIDEVAEKLNKMNAQIKSLIRKESDITLPLAKLVDKNDTLLRNEIINCENVLNIFKEITNVSIYEMIYPCLIRQSEQTESLSKLTKTSVKNFSTLSYKVDNSRMMLDSLIFSMVEHTMTYVTRRNSIKRKLCQQKELLIHIKDKIKRKSELLVTIDDNIRRLLDICLPLKMLPPTKKIVYHELTISPPDIDVVEALALLKKKATILTTAYGNMQLLTPSQLNISHTLHNKLLERYAYKFEPIRKFKEESLFDEFAAVDLSIPTRESLKAESKRIVEECNIDPDLVIQPIKKRR